MQNLSSEIKLGSQQQRRILSIWNLPYNNLMFASYVGTATFKDSG